MFHCQTIFEVIIKRRHCAKRFVITYGLRRCAERWMCCDCSGRSCVCGTRRDAALQRLFAMRHWHFSSRCVQRVVQCCFGLRRAYRLRVYLSIIRFLSVQVSQLCIVRRTSRQSKLHLLHRVPSLALFSPLAILMNAAYVPT